MRALKPSEGSCASDPELQPEPHLGTTGHAAIHNRAARAAPADTCQPELRGSQPLTVETCRK